MSILKKLFKAADQHGEDAGVLDHTVGDLQALLHRSWEIMTIEQRAQLLRSAEVYNVVECGSRGEFAWDDLVKELMHPLGGQESELLAAGYELKTQPDGSFFWETEEEASEDFYNRADAVANAFAHFQTMKLIAELDRDAATDLLDECYGVGCRDEQDLDALRAEVLEGYRSGKISSAAIQALG